MKPILFWSLSFILVPCLLFAQTQIQQDIKGLVGNATTRQTIANAEVEILYFNPQKFTTTDAEGNFLLSDVPVGRHRLLVKAPGYEETVLNDVIITSGKTMYLKIYLNEEVNKDANNNPDVAKKEEPKKFRAPITRIKDNAVNTMVDVSSQTFTMDEVNRYSGSRSDVARLVTGFAGIMNADDARNDIISRGATSLGIQWRLEGMPIGNPNHFGYLSTTAGYFPIVNVNAMANSDFMYGNISAEYGNSTSGTFDINLRKGSIDRFEKTVQFGLNGAEILLEGPLRRGSNASFLVAARYSVLKLFGTVLNFGISTLPDYADLNMNIFLVDNKKRQSSLFGIVGYSKIFTPYTANKEGSLTTNDGNKDNSTTSINSSFGWKHREFLSENVYWQTTIGSTITYNKEIDKFYVLQPDSSYLPYTGRDEKYLQVQGSLNSFVNAKFSRKLNMRAGLSAQYRYNDFFCYENRYDTLGYNPLLQKFNTILAELYGQIQYKFSNKLRMSLGIHGQYSTLNRKVAAEPRFSLIWDAAKRHRLSLGYALQSSELPYRLMQNRYPSFDSLGRPISYTTPNTSLDFMRNHYATLEYTFKISEFWQIKAMPYYRYWTSLPVESDSLSSYSLFNYDSEELSNFVPVRTFKSSGTAINYGLDLSLQKTFSKGFYMVLNGSWINSKYKGSDKVERNSRFNRNYIARLMAGKEFAVGSSKKSVLFFSTTLTYAHGGYTTALDLANSQLLQDEAYISNAFTKQIPSYFRWDVKVGMRINSRKRVSHYFYIDVMNALNTKNIARYYYNTAQNIESPTYQVGIIPDILYRIQF